MKKKRKFLIISVVFIAMFVSCSKEINLEYSVPKKYRLWKKPVKEVLDYPVPGHGDTYRVIYANEIAYKAAFRKDGNGNERIVLPDGAVIIKEVYKKREDINWVEPSLTIMLKDKKNTNAQSGWLYYARKPGEKKAKLVKGRMCIGCHEAANDRHIYFDNNEKGIFRDYLFVNFVSSGSSPMH